MISALANRAFSYVTVLQDMAGFETTLLEVHIYFICRMFKLFVSTPELCQESRFQLRRVLKRGSSILRGGVQRSASVLSQLQRFMNRSGTSADERGAMLVGNLRLLWTAVLLLFMC